MNRRYLNEVFDALKELQTDKEKIEHLRKHESKQLRVLLNINFNPNIKFIVQGEIAYKPNTAPFGLAESTLFREARLLYLYVDNNGDVRKLDKEKRTRMYTGLLEVINAAEAQLLETVRAKELEKVYGLTAKTVEAAFPGILSEAALVEQKPQPKKSTRKTKSKSAQEKSSEVSSDNPKADGNDVEGEDRSNSSAS